MKLNQARIKSLSHALLERLLRGRFIELKTDQPGMTGRLEKVITDELLLEDRLNQEVDQILRAYESEIEKGNVDYHRMFQLTKKQLAKERGIIL